mmetsp:Transcript_61354/g.179316  ORF Transcript_61354/g.179316 Transcript_61354/m.179316 type:complete len:233 (-) Transcript_61354:440-1138(-)
MGAPPVDNSTTSLKGPAPCSFRARMRKRYMVSSRRPATAQPSALGTREVGAGWQPTAHSRGFQLVSPEMLPLHAKRAPHSATAFHWDGPPGCTLQPQQLEAAEQNSSHRSRKASGPASPSLLLETKDWRMLEVSVTLEQKLPLLERMNGTAGAYAMQEASGTPCMKLPGPSSRYTSNPVKAPSLLAGKDQLRWMVVGCESPTCLVGGSISLGTPAATRGSHALSRYPVAVSA